MIYFEFAIRPAPNAGTSGSPEFEIRTAEFMFDLDNPAECTRRAAAVLLSKGWRPVHVKQAREAFKIEDFEADEHVAALYREAQGPGMSFRLNVPETALAADVPMAS